MLGTIPVLGGGFQALAVGGVVIFAKMQPPRGVLGIFHTAITAGHGHIVVRAAPLCSAIPSDQNQDDMRPLDDIQNL